jgi:hypothetical protein
MRDGLRRRGPLQHQRTFQPSNIWPLPLGGLWSIEGLRAPVAQLDRALPSEARAFWQWRLLNILLDQGGGANDSPFCTKCHVSGTNPHSNVRTCLSGPTTGLPMVHRLEVQPTLRPYR